VDKPIASMDFPLTAANNHQLGDAMVGSKNMGTGANKNTTTTLSDPSATPEGGTEPVSINDRGQVTGSYNNGTTALGFLYSGGTWTTLTDPSVVPGGAIAPIAINDRGQIIGVYDNGTAAQVGFIATPTDVDHKREPPTLTITGRSLSVAGEVRFRCRSAFRPMMPTTKCRSRSAEFRVTTR
jgi:hypothetical protein